MSCDITAVVFSAIAGDERDVGVGWMWSISARQSVMLPTTIWHEKENIECINLNRLVT
eukprot:gene9018-1347_t